MSKVGVFLPESVLVGNGTQQGAQAPVIYHAGITSAQLGQLKGCARKVNPNPFPGTLEQWRGAMVRFAIVGGDEVFRTIESICIKPLTDVNDSDVVGTLAEIAMREMGLTFEQFFREAYGQQSHAMIIRVR